MEQRKTLHHQIKWLGEDMEPFKLYIEWEQAVVCQDLGEGIGFQKQFLLQRLLSTVTIERSDQRLALKFRGVSMMKVMETGHLLTTAVCSGKKCFVTDGIACL